MRLHLKLQDIMKLEGEKPCCPFCKQVLAMGTAYFYACSCRQATNIKYQFDGENSGFNALSFRFKMNRGMVWVSVFFPEDRTSFTFVKKGNESSIQVPTTDFPWLDLAKMREKVSTLIIFA